MLRLYYIMMLKSFLKAPRLYLAWQYPVMLGIYGRDSTEEQMKAIRFFMQEWLDALEHTSTWNEAWMQMSMDGEAKDLLNALVEAQYDGYIHRLDQLGRFLHSLWIKVEEAKAAIEDTKSRL